MSKKSDEKSDLVADYKERFVWLDGCITPKLADKFRRVMARLNKSEPAPIVLYIRGPGGEPHSALAMMNDIVNSKSPVVIVAHDFVNSACFLITQAGACRLAMAGTTFTFHPAVAVVFKKKYKEDEIQFTQAELIDSLERLRLTDGIQLTWFLKKGRPTQRIFNLFRVETTISVPKAQKLRLIDDYYDKKDFIKDRRIANRLLKAK